MKHTAKDISDFRQIVWDYYRAAKRQMPWRETRDPYQILVSEVMLQQTQVQRVIPKFEAFIARFPTFNALSSASFAEVLTFWQGLGYNRRAQYLHRSATKVIENNWHNHGAFSTDPVLLTQLPGIGINTASAVIVYVHNVPIPFIETNIRTVFLHHFFPEVYGVDDRELLESIEQMLDHENPREWYWALMDYGTHLKQTQPNPSRRSKHHITQSTFEGSTRQLRGKILKMLTSEPADYDVLKLEISDDRFDTILSKLLDEQMIVRNGDIVSIAT